MDRYEETSEEKVENIDFIELGLKFLTKWHWFVVSVFVCMLAAFTYLYFATPEYNIASSIIINDDKRGGSISMDAAIFESLGISGVSGNVDNEVIILRSLTNTQTTIKELGLYTTYHQKNGLKYYEIYPHTNSALTVNLIDRPIEKLENVIFLEVNVSDKGAITIISETTNNKKEDKQTLIFDKFPAFFTTLSGTVEISQNEQVELEPESTYKIVIFPLLVIARKYSSTLTVAPVSKTTSVINLSSKFSHKTKGTDFLDHLVRVYNNNASQDKNETTQKTVDFLTERLEVINQDLEKVELRIQNFKEGAKLTDINYDAQVITQQYNLYEQKRVENATQLSLVRYLKDYMNNPENRNELVPVNIGVSDASLNLLVSKYNEMLLERKRIELVSTDKNPTLINLDNTIQSVFSNILTTLNNLQNNLLIARNNLDEEAQRFGQRITAAPMQERALVSIAREQATLSAISQFLLQRKEENSIALAVTTDNAKFIDRAIADRNPVSPRKNLILLAVFMFALCIPAGIILLMSWLQFKITNQSDINKITSVPVLGTISKLKDVDKASTVQIKANQNDQITEEFRAIRANLHFMSASNKQVILLTSSISGEGKSFVSANLAVSLSLLKKKVVLLGLDLRRPALLQLFQVNSKNGMSQYLYDPENYPLEDSILHVPDNDYLDIIPAGPIPPNATELLSSPVLEKAIEQLKQQYDYIILDTAPVGLVADTLMIGKCADVSIYLCRADYTHKKDFEYIEELRQKKSLPGLCTILNAFDIEKNKHYGKYGSGYGYGAKRYGGYE